MKRSDAVELGKEAEWDKANKTNRYVLEKPKAKEMSPREKKQNQAQGSGGKDREGTVKSNNDRKNDNRVGKSGSNARKQPVKDRGPFQKPGKPEPVKKKPAPAPEPIKSRDAKPLPQKPIDKGLKKPAPKPETPMKDRRSRADRISDRADRRAERIGERREKRAERQEKRADRQANRRQKIGSAKAKVVGAVDNVRGAIARRREPIKQAKAEARQKIKEARGKAKYGKIKMKPGGLKEPSEDQKGLKKLPTAVRNKMGYAKKGKMIDRRAGGYGKKKK